MALDMMMKIEEKLLKQIVSDLGLDVPFSRGKNIPVNNCWHFSTDGNAVEAIFQNEDDFISGMNRVYLTVRGFRVIILAFCLMDTHVHFVLYGEYDECNRFMHEFIRRTSWDISVKHGESKKLKRIPISHQKVDTDFYLKLVICYTIKNPSVGGIPFHALDYPWSSGSLYFRRPDYWTTPGWLQEGCRAGHLFDHSRELQRKLLNTRDLPTENVRMTGPMVFPGEYVAWELVERIYTTCKSFNYFFCITKEEDIEARGGTLSLLSLPMQEMRQHKNDVCKELFGVGSIKTLNTQQRIRVAKTLRARYNSSIKQIARLCGLVYEEVKDML